MVVWTLPPEWTPWVTLLADRLHARVARRLLPLLLGLLLARGRRTVASWLRAAGVGRGWPAYYYALARVGRAAPRLAAAVLRLLLDRLATDGPLVFGIDDTPTRRYGPKVQGAGVHRDPAPGPTGRTFLYGHLWVTLAWLLRHPRWGSVGLPIRAELYVRRANLGGIPARCRWVFHTKLELAAELVRWLADWSAYLGRALWVVVDGGYAKAPFLRPAARAGAIVVGRLRKDAALRDLPPAPRPGRRRPPGRPRKYGRHRLSLAKRAGQRRGWQAVEAELYGRRVTQPVKTFLATWPPVGGVLRVVLVREGPGWLAFFCTDPQATAAQVLEAVAARGALEQDFHDLKEVEGLGQQQLRNVWANVGAFHLNLWAHALVELWAWDQPKRAICDRRSSPWDDPTRRPSHADRRKALQRECLGQAFSRGGRRQPLSRKTQTLIRRLIALLG
jgi:hypothetical protein